MSGLAGWARTGGRGRHPPASPPALSPSQRLACTPQAPPGGASTSPGSGGCNPASCRQRPWSPPSSCCRRCPAGRPRRRSGRSARGRRAATRAERTMKTISWPSRGKIWTRRIVVWRAHERATGCSRAACAQPSLASSPPPGARTRGSSRTGRPRQGRSSAAHRPATATTDGAAGATPWRSAAPRRNRPRSPEPQGPRGSEAETAGPDVASSRWPQAGAQARRPTAQASASAGSCARTCARSHRPEPPCVSCFSKPANHGRAS